jgi:excinuclease ABC subunit C
MVVFRNGRPDRAGYRKFKMRTVTGQDDFACMAETVRRRYTRLVSELKASAATPPDPAPTAAPAGEKSALPGLILIDGGKGQLNAACAELAKLGLSQIPVIGLAKEFEEIYRPGQKEPLRLSHDSAALKLLQRVRDESHRLANTYNAQLRLKRISESLLDEFPGIGEQRKAALLKRFGSVRRLQLASTEEIATVPGFGGKAAAELKAFLEARRELGAGMTAGPVPEPGRSDTL